MKIFPTMIVVIAAAGAAPTFVIPESVQHPDTIKLSPLRLVESTQRRDQLVLNPAKLTEQQNRSDAFRIPSATVAINDSIKKTDTAIFTASLTAVSPSGTPNADDWGDAWTDATVGQTGTNHGTTSPLSVVGAAVGTKVAWMKANLRRYTGLTAIGGTHTLTFRMTSNEATGTQTYNCNMKSNGAVDPFTESTIAQNNQPAIPNTIVKSFTLAAGATATISITLSDSDMNLLLGNWMLLAITGPGAAILGATVVSREGAAADRATLNFKAQV